MTTVYGNTPGADAIRVCVNDYSLSSNGVQPKELMRRPVADGGDWHAELPGGAYLLRWREGSSWLARTVLVPGDGTHDVSDLQPVSSGEVASAVHAVADSAYQPIVPDRVQVYADRTGTTVVDQAIADAVSSGKTVIYLPAGTYKINSSISLAQLSGKSLIGAGLGKTVILAQDMTSPALLGTSGQPVTDLNISGITVDMSWSAGKSTVAGIQITNGARVRISDCEVRNSGGAGILLQGLGSGDGTKDSTIQGCLIDGSGLSDGTTGHGIWIKDSSPRCVVANNRVRNVKGGMGIGMSGSAGTGYPTYGQIEGNVVTDMQASSTGFEAIGITSGCTNTVVSGNTVLTTKDNGISVTADRCTVVGNNVEDTFNHGITAGGKGTTVTGNYVRNVGKENPALGFGGICLDTGASYCVVVGNRVTDDQGTHTMGYGVKINSSGGYNKVGPNSIDGWLTSAYNGFLSTDLNIDAESYNNGFAFPRVFTDYLASKTSSGSISCSSTMYLTNQIIIGSGASKTSQLTVLSNAPASRSNMALVVQTGQTANALDVYNKDGNVIASVTKDGAVKPLTTTTTNRPTAASVGAGAMAFDTTLNKPIWSTGSAWVDASGATV